MEIYSKERFEQVMDDFKNVVLPQVKTEIEARAKKTALAAAVQRIANIETIIGDASASDADNIINKVVEFVAFFANITEDKTLAGMLATTKTELEAEIEHISYSNGALNKTVGGDTTKICDVVTSGFRITHNNETGADEFEAIGTATFTHNNETGADSFVF